MVAIIGEAGVAVRPEMGRFASEAESQVGVLKGTASKAAGFFAAAFAAVGIGTFLKGAVEQATDLGESASKVGVVFGDAAGTVTAFAENASTSLGLSEAAALGAAGTFGNLLRSVGLTEKASADMSTSMIGLAGDLASFNNVSPEEALDALRSGLVGETEPLKAFGVNMNEAALSAKAVELGLAASGETLDANAKAQAAYALIMEQTSLAQGDFGRTSAGLANQQRIVGAQFKDLQANIGGLFVPALANAAAGVTGGLMPGLLRLTTHLPEVGDALGAVGDYFRIGFTDGLDAVFKANADVQGFARTITIIAGNVGDLSAVFREAFVDGAAGSANLGASGLLGFATTAGDAAHTIAASFSGVWDGLMDSLHPILLTLIPAIQTAAAQIMEVFSGAFSGGGGGGGPFSFLTGIADAVGPILETLGPLIAGFVGRYAQIFQALLPGIVAVIQAIVPIVSDLFAQIGPLIGQLMPVIQQVAGLVTGALVGAITALVPAIGPLATAIGGIVAALAGGFMAVIQALLPVIPTLVGVVAQLAEVLAGALGGAIAAIAPVLPAIATVIAQVAGALAGTLAAVLQGLLPVLPPLVEAFAAIAQVLIGALMGALSAILPIIPTLVGALLALVEAAILPLLPLLPMLAQLLLMIVSALAPLIPPLMQIIMLIIQLVIAAITPLMPIIPVIVGLFGMLLQALMPIIGVVMSIVQAFVGMVSTIISVVVGFVSTLVGVWTGLWSAITGIISRIVGGATSGFQGLKDGIGRIFSGMADFVGGMFEGIGGAIKSAINAVIGGLNGTLIAGINVAIDGVNLVNPFDDIPHVPNIPTFHSGGEFYSGQGEGLALLADRELVVTQQQREVADALLRRLLDGDLPAGGAAARTEPPVQVNNHITQLPGESGTVLAARVTQGAVWNLSHRITRRTGDAAVEPAR